MNPQPYTDLSNLALLELCVFREAEGEPLEGKRGVAHVIRNRANSGKYWWGHDWQSVILHPYQFSSFNPGTPRERVWPRDADPAFADCCQACIPVMLGTDEDLTRGAMFYHDSSIGWPAAWGNEADYTLTLEVGRLKFYKQNARAVPDSSGDVHFGDMT